MNKKKINEAQLLAEVLADKEMRIAFFEHDFPAWFMYHFGWDGLKEFHSDWMDDFA